MRRSSKRSGRRDGQPSFIATALATLASIILLAPVAGEPQEAEKAYRIGYILSGSPPAQPGRTLFGLQLRELGWIEGRNVLIEDRFAEGELDRLPAVVADLLRLGVDIIMTDDTPTARAAKEATRTVPIVMTAGNPVRSGLIASLARPGGNITGIDVATVDMRAKSLQLLREVVPKASHIGFLVRSGNPAGMQSWQELNAAAPSLGVQMRRFDVTEPADIDSAFALMARDRLGGLIVQSDPSILIPQRKRIVDLAARVGVPALYPWRYFVEAGGLMSYGHDVRHIARLKATYVDRILKGAKPADLPVERPAKLELVINMRTARTLGVRIPPSLLARADEIFE